MAKQGGAREGAGRKKLYKKPAPISFIIEQEEKDLLKKKYTGSELKKYFNKWLDFLLDR